MPVQMTILAVAMAALTLSACGHTQSDRTLSGAGIGAGTGALGAAITGGSLAGGAIVGGAVGAAAGALTDEGDINFGKPAWR
jgi:hypothetical protein